MTHSLPLDGIRVLDFAHMMQGPWAVEMLAATPIANAAKTMSTGCESSSAGKYSPRFVR